MSSAQTSVEPVRRTVVVDRSVEDAFRVFTEEIGKWWALEVHSLSLDRTGAPAETAIMEGQVGGRLYERMSDGAEADWGRLLVWEPPHRVVFEWFVTGTPTEAISRKYEVAISGAWAMPRPTPRHPPVTMTALPL